MTDPGEQGAAIPCRVCGSTGAMRAEGPVLDYITGDHFTLRACRSCGFAVTDPVPADLDRYYPSRYRRFGFVARTVLRALYRRRVRAWTRRLGRRGVALEIGCGDGWMLHALREHGWRVLGSERSAASASVAATTNGIPMFVGDLDAIAPGPRFDLIVMFHVLEHLADPVGMLRRCERLLRPGGTIVIGVPNFGSWQSRAFGARWFHLDVPRHLVHFTPGALERALGAAGLARTALRFESFEHDPYGWVQSTENALGIPQNTLTKLLTGMPGFHSPLVSAIALVIAAPLTVAGTLLALASWRSGAGAVMETWAARAR